MSSRPIRLRALRRVLWLVALPAALIGAGGAGAGELTIEGDFVQGGLLRGSTEPGSEVRLDGDEVRVSAGGLFLLGFGRDARPEAELVVRFPDGSEERRPLGIAQRDYQVQEIDGLPDKLVSPSTAELERIDAENALIAEARARDTDASYFASGFVWPVLGTITGLYGSQRILNGEPRRPHYGIDIAAPEGEAVLAAADAVVALVHHDMFFTGATLILDHGFGLTSVYSHLSAIHVRPGQRVDQGETVAEVGATGRATGPHLDWRVNLFSTRLDPALLVGPMPLAAPAPGRP